MSYQNESEMLSESVNNFIAQIISKGHKERISLYG